MSTTLTNTFDGDLLSLAALVKVGNSFGSGIYIHINTEVYFATARHVLFNEMLNSQTEEKGFALKSKEINIKSYPKNSSFQSFEEIQVDLTSLSHSKHLSLNSTHDLAIFKVGDFIKNKLLLTKGITKISGTLSLNIASQNLVKPVSQISVGEEIYVIGFPKALALTNSHLYNYDKPLVRKGIISGINPNQTIVIDCAVYGGNSGGPVFIAEKIITQAQGSFKIKNHRYLAGIVSKYIPLLNTTAQKIRSNTSSSVHFENSGYGIIVAFEEIMNEINRLIKTRNSIQ